MSEADAGILFELRVLNPHGAEVHDADVMVHGEDGGYRAAEREGVYRLHLPRGGDYQLRVERFGRDDGFDHRTLRATFFLVPSAQGLLARRLKPPQDERSRIERMEVSDSTVRAVATLDYLWFTHIGFPPTQGNDVQLLVDGKEGWGSVAKDIGAAKNSVHLTTWIYEPTTELERPEPLADPDQRATFPVHEMLEERAAAGARVRLLLWDAPVLQPPKEAREAGRTAGDRFEVLEQNNPTERQLFPDRWALANRLLGNFQIGSYHQKTVVVDGKVGYCGGMNLKENDWDSRVNQLFDPRRCRFNRSHEHRLRVQSKEEKPDHLPRHDFIARIAGPAVKHLEDNFRQRWNHMIDEDAKWADQASAMAVPRAVRRRRRGSAVQVVRTMPEPFDERGILDVHIRAVNTARKLIFIEDQYFRSTHLSDAIADAVRRWPELHVIVLTIQGQAEGLGTGAWTRECFERIQRRLPESRRRAFELYSLKVWDRDADGRGHLEDVDNHSKLMIVDDRFLTVGSCNINDRGFEYEGEINIAVVDPPKVRAWREDIWRAHLGDDRRIGGGVDGDVAVWMEHAAANRAFARSLSDAPRSKVFPFVPPANQRIVSAPDVF